MRSHHARASLSLLGIMRMHANAAAGQLRRNPAHFLTYSVLRFKVAAAMP